MENRIGDKTQVTGFFFISTTVLVQFEPQIVWQENIISQTHKKNVFEYRIFLACDGL